MCEILINTLTDKLHNKDYQFLSEMFKQRMNNVKKKLLIAKSSNQIDYSKSYSLTQSLAVRAIYIIYKL